MLRFKKPQVSNGRTQYLSSFIITSFRSPNNSSTEVVKETLVCAGVNMIMISDYLI